MEHLATYISSAPMCRFTRNLIVCCYALAIATLLHIANIDIYSYGDKSSSELNAM